MQETSRLHDIHLRIGQKIKLFDFRKQFGNNNNNNEGSIDKQRSPSSQSRGSSCSINSRSTAASSTSSPTRKSTKYHPRNSTAAGYFKEATSRVDVHENTHKPELKMNQIKHLYSASTFTLHDELSTQQLGIDPSSSGSSSTRQSVGYLEMCHNVPGLPRAWHDMKSNPSCCHGPIDGQTTSPCSTCSSTPEAGVRETLPAGTQLRSVTRLNDGLSECAESASAFPFPPLHSTANQVSPPITTGRTIGDSKRQSGRIEEPPSIRRSSGCSSLGSISTDGMMPLVTPIKTGKKVQYRKTKACPWNQHGRCVMGDCCNYAHTKTELRGRPDLTRTRLCPEVATCKKVHCRFAHDVSQLRATGAFFRTKLCKFWVRGSKCPSGDFCRHAHGENQLRNPAAIGGPEKDCESPRETIILSGLCSRTVDSARGVETEIQNGLDVVGGFAGYQGSCDKSFPPVESSHDSYSTGVQSYSADGTEESQGIFGLASQSPTNASCRSDDLFARFSDAELTAAVTEYLLLNDVTKTPSTVTSDLASFLESCDSVDTMSADSEADEINRLVKALTVSSDQPTTLHPSPPLVATRYSDSMRQATDQSRSTTTFFPRNSAEATMTQHSLMFPPPVAVSAADLKLNDILNIAVASQDPDLLECSAKILRASIRYKQQQEQHLLKQQQIVPSVAAPTTSGYASPRLSKEFNNQLNIFNPCGNNNQAMYL